MAGPEQRNRNDEGRYESEHEVNRNDVFEAMEPLEPYSTRELADELEAPRRTIFKYLEELHELGKIRKKKPGPRSAVWIRGK